MVGLRIASDHSPQASPRAARRHGRAVRRTSGGSGWRLRDLRQPAEVAAAGRGSRSQDGPGARPVVSSLQPGAAGVGRSGVVVQGCRVPGARERARCGRGRACGRGELRCLGAATSRARCLTGCRRSVQTPASCRRSPPSGEARTTRRRNIRTGVVRRSQARPGARRGDDPVRWLGAVAVAVFALATPIGSTAVTRARGAERHGGVGHGPPARVEYALRLAASAFPVPYGELRSVSWCESHWDARAVNGGGSGSSGLFQFLPSTWQRTPFAGFSIFDPIANALAAGWLVAHDGGWREWTCKP